MKKILMLIITLTAAVTLNAQNTDGGATAILQSVSKKYQTLSTMNINYTFKVEKDKKVLETLTGTIKIKGDKYTAQLGDQELFYDGKTIWNYQKEMQEVSIFEPDPESPDNILNPAKLLSGWSKIYSAKFIREETRQNKTLQIIDLKPLKQADVYKVRLLIDKNKKEIYSISTYEVDNTISTYQIDKFVSNAPIDDKQFTFDTTAHPDVDINDMR